VDHGDLTAESFQRKGELIGGNKEIEVTTKRRHFKLGKKDENEVGSR